MSISWKKRAYSPKEELLSSGTHKTENEKGATRQLVNLIYLTILQVAAKNNQGLL